MKIYLVRHGESTPSANDNERPLSEQGKADIEKLAQFLAPLKLTVSRLVQSEKLRAQQTAKILLSSIQVSDYTETSPTLDPLASPQEIIDDLYLYGKDSLLVGHMPFMGRLVTQLISGHDNEDIIAIIPGTMLCLEQIASEQWVIRWVINPELFQYPHLT